MKHHRFTAIAAFATIFVAGCGGGGSSSPSTPVAAGAAQHHLAYEPFHWDISGTDSVGARFRLVLDQTVLAPAIFPGNGVSGTRQQQAYALYAQGDLAASGTTVSYFATGRDLPMGTVNEDGTCNIASGSVAVPASAEIGDSGPMYQDNYYADCNKSALLGVSGMHWSVKRLDDITFYCQDNSATDAGVTTVESQCFETNEQGEIGTRMRYSISSKLLGNDYLLVMRNY